MSNRQPPLATDIDCSSSTINQHSPSTAVVKHCLTTESSANSRHWQMRGSNDAETYEADHEAAIDQEIEPV